MSSHLLKHRFQWPLFISNSSPVSVNDAAIRISKH